MGKYNNVVFSEMDIRLDGVRAALVKGGLERSHGVLRIPGLVASVSNALREPTGGDMPRTREQGIGEDVCGTILRGHCAT